MTDKSAALILAAGQGKRMQSALPKVLHPCCEVPLVAHVVRLAQARGCSPVVVVVSPDNEAAVRAELTGRFGEGALRFAVQRTPRGTGDAARAGMAALGRHRGHVLILYGDVPLLGAATVERLQAATAAAPLALLTAKVAAPYGYGRIRRAAGPQGAVLGIVEERDCSAAERLIDEVNAGVYVAEAGLLGRALAGLTADNAQREYYLTDIVAHAAARGGAVGVPVADVDEIRGVNSRAELAVAEALLRRRLVAAHQAAGVSFHDPEGTFVGADVRLGRDVDVGMGVQLCGRTEVHEGARLEGPCVVRDSVIGRGCQVRAFCHLEQATLAAAAQVGPFARLRPQAQLDEGAHVGNFVEMKKARLGRGAKAGHLSYLGDAEVGPGSNIGAGTITCNYDGFGKHRTRIGANVFVGSSSTLVAPIHLADGAFVAAGSTLTEDVPADGLAFGRARQVTRPGGAKILRDRLAAVAQQAHGAAPAARRAKPAAAAAPPRSKSKSRSKLPSKSRPAARKKKGS